MSMLKHKTLGEGKIIRRDERSITVQFEKDGSEKRLLIPESFLYGLFTLEGDLKDEVEAAIAAKIEAEQKEREAKAAARAKLQEQTKAPSVRTARAARSSEWETVVSSLDSAVKDGYEAYLIQEEYKELTPSGNRSTVPQYIRAVEDVLVRERLTWSTLEPQIAPIVTLYGPGGAKEAIGKKSNKTWINALRRFKDFAEQSTTTV